MLFESLRSAFCSSRLAYPVCLAHLWLISSVRLCRVLSMKIEHPVLYLVLYLVDFRALKICIYILIDGHITLMNDIASVLLNPSPLSEPEKYCQRRDSRMHLVFTHGHLIC